MSKHSAGPWESHFSIHGDPSVVTDANRPAFTKVCDVSTAPSDYGQANCRLIAAAPDMLEALRDAVRLIRYLGGNAGCQEKAIDKAEGCDQTFDCNAGDHADCCAAQAAE